MAQEVVQHKKRIRILIADDQAHVRKAIQLIVGLEDDMEVVGMAQIGVEAVELAERNHPDVMLMDLSMPHLDGLEAMRLLRNKGLPVPVIAIVSSGDPVSWDRIREAGAVAWVEKGAPGAQVTEMIRSIYHPSGTGDEQQSKKHETRESSED